MIIGIITDMQYPNSVQWLHYSYFVVISQVYIIHIIRRIHCSTPSNLLLLLDNRGMGEWVFIKIYQVAKGGALGGYGVEYSVISALETSPPQFSLPNHMNILLTKAP